MSTLIVKISMNIKCPNCAEDIDFESECNKDTSEVLQKNIVYGDIDDFYAQLECQSCGHEFEIYDWDWPVDSAEVKEE